MPPFVPFAQAFAAAITAALTGSLYYIAASPKDPTYITAPVLKTPSARDELKQLFAAWYERRQMKKIYSPLLEGLLGLYLGFEWIQVLLYYRLILFIDVKRNHNLKKKNIADKQPSCSYHHTWHILGCCIG